MADTSSVDLTTAEVFAATVASIIVFCAGFVFGADDANRQFSPLTKILASSAVVWGLLVVIVHFTR